MKISLTKRGIQIILGLTIIGTIGAFYKAYTGEKESTLEEIKNKPKTQQTASKDKPKSNENKKEETPKTDSNEKLNLSTRVDIFNNTFKLECTERTRVNEELTVKLEVENNSNMVIDIEKDNIFLKNEKQDSFKIKIENKEGMGVNKILLNPREKMEVFIKTKEYKESETLYLDITRIWSIGGETKDVAVKIEVP